MSEPTLAVWRCSSVIVSSRLSPNPLTLRNLFLSGVATDDHFERPRRQVVFTALTPATPGGACDLPYGGNVRAIRPMARCSVGGFGTSARTVREDADESGAGGSITNDGGERGLV
jgi:hypothetical protein